MVRFSGPIIETFRRIGLFDTLGYQTYSNSQEFADLIAKTDDISPLPIGNTGVNRHAPVYLVLPHEKSDMEIRLISRIKKARLQFRSYDPEENGRLSAREAIENVVSSHGVVIPLLSKTFVDAPFHNIRAAFIAGLSQALDKVLLLIQKGDEPVPLDYRDLVSVYHKIDQIDEIIGAFSPRVTARLQQEVEPKAIEPKGTLSSLNLGASAAENEISSLGQYYLQTDEYYRALRAEIQLVRGRKGAGKTALFFQLRNTLRENKQRIVLDLKPEGYQLVKFKERILNLLEEGTKEHLIVAFWEYVILLEICHKILEKDKERHYRDHRLFNRYRQLEESYQLDPFIGEGDFAERILNLTQRITDDYLRDYGTTNAIHMMTSQEVTKLLYKHDLGHLRDQIVDYLSMKEGVWILFDNLDKGWPAHGLTPDDVLTIRCLLDAIYILIRLFERNDIECNGVVFIRDDIYEHLLSAMPDRGKLSEVTLDWSDENLLRELVHRRLVFSGLKYHEFEDSWRKVAISHIRGEETSQFLIDRCLRRPRALIDLLQFCRSHAVNLGHNRIELLDIEWGEESFSTELITNVGFEIRDVFPEAADVLYAFIEAPSQLTTNELTELIFPVFPDSQRQERLVDLLLWYGFLGFVREDGSSTFVYDVKYDLKRLKAHIAKRSPDELRYCINPAFWKGLEVRHAKN